MRVKLNTQRKDFMYREKPTKIKGCAGEEGEELPACL